MEILKFEFHPNVPIKIDGSPVLVGVVSSGNLEVLVEKDDLEDGCRFEVNTVTAGFEKIWYAVLEDFLFRHPISNVRFSINDMGATPAVVSLRLDQALEVFSRSKI